MPKDSKSLSARKANIDKARTDSKKDTSPYVDAPTMAYSAITTGNTFESIQKLFLSVGINCAGMSSFYEHQKKQIPIFIQRAKESCEYWKRRMKPNTTVGIDAAWDHPRNGEFCIVDLFDTKTNKVIDYVVFSKKDVFGSYTYSESSQGMEKEGVRILVARNKDNENITHFVHDKDGKTTVEFRDGGWKITELFDLNHAFKSFHKFFENFNITHNRYLTGLEFKISKWAHILIDDEEITIEEKKERYLLAAEHFTGNHEHCHHDKKEKYFKNAHIDEPDFKKVLLEFLRETSFVVTNCKKDATTQMNESFHAMKIRYADKDTKWATSFPARMAAAVLDVNGPDNWKFLLRIELGLKKLPDIILKKHQKILEKTKYYRIKRRTEEFQKGERIRRYLKRKQIKVKAKKDKDTYNTMKNELPLFGTMITGPNFVKLFKKIPDGKLKNYFSAGPGCRSDITAGKILDDWKYYIIIEQLYLFLYCFIPLFADMFNIPVAKIIPYLDSYYMQEFKGSGTSLHNDVTEKKTVFSDQAQHIVTEKRNFDDIAKDNPLKINCVDDGFEIRYPCAAVYNPATFILDCKVFTKTEKIPEEYLDPSKYNLFLMENSFYVATRHNFQYSMMPNSYLSIRDINGEPCVVTVPYNKTVRCRNPLSGRDKEIKISKGDLVTLSFPINSFYNKTMEPWSVIIPPKKEMPTKKVTLKRKKEDDKA